MNEGRRRRKKEKEKDKESEKEKEKEMEIWFGGLFLPKEKIKHLAGPKNTKHCTS